MQSIINGLDVSYQPFKSAYKLNRDPMMLDDFIGTLLQEETNVTSTNDGLLPTPLPSVNLSHSYHRPSTTTTNSNNRLQNAFSDSVKGVHPLCGHTSNSDRPTCQICDKVGHTAKDCYHRTNLNSYPTKHNNSTRPQRRQSPNAEAFFASPSSIVDPSWYLDSGANHHVTNQLENLSLQSDYSGEDKLTVGNGMALPITHYGSCTLPASPSPLKLSNVLVVPHITKNLLNISQLTADNNIYIEFHPHCCLVKNLQGKILLKGHVEHGLYRLPQISTSTPQVYLGERTS